MILDFVKANIVDVTADAIVLPANSALKEGSGASTAIFSAAGRKKLTDACNKIGYCPVGSAVPTLAFKLNAKYIIHAVAPKWVDGEHDEYNLLCSAYISALKIADIMGCESIAFPLLASGNNGYDLELAFQIAKESIETFEAISLKRVLLVLFGNRITTIVKDQGFVVLDIPEHVEKQKIRLAHKNKAKKLAADGKEVFQQFLEDQVEKTIDYLKDEKNREKIFDMAVFIVKKIYKLAKDSKSSDDE